MPADTIKYNLVHFCKAQNYRNSWARHGVLDESTLDRPQLKSIVDVKSHDFRMRSQKTLNFYTLKLEADLTNLNLMIYC